MELYFGGAYNGKIKLVKKIYDIKDNDIFYCDGSELDYSKKVICGLHNFIYSRVLEGLNSIEYIEKNIEKLKDKVIICDDLSSGIVPLKKEDRKWREETGKVLQLLAKESNKVVRVFLGIPGVLKDE